MPERVVDLWWAYWQVEPFGMQWEQSASVMSMLSGLQSLHAATMGAKVDTMGVADFMPAVSVPWAKKSKPKSRGATDPRVQEMILRQAMGFR